MTSIVALCVALAGITALTHIALSEDSEKKPRIGLTVDQLSPAERELVDNFYHLFTTKTRGVMVSKWFGILTWQHPFDLWVTQEIMYEQKPDLVVEAGTFRGGSSIIWAMMLEHINPEGSVVTIDIEDKREERAKQMPIAKRKVKFLLGSSTAPEIVAEVKRRAEGKNVLLILDSLHTKDHVLDELRAYWKLVPVGGYIIVQDSAINGHPIAPWTGPGPWEAVEAFMAENDHFQIDKARERFLLTNNPNGFLRRVH
ncbi:MAG: class I SAM-dependent methyltransferase [Deltaproteobacteria bacterium]|nr:class I SAM-dependent methyltransferase [Deltaproteobacteria bacterium]MBW2723812.1 class I SAM-dependent methyltransferase [Deltaproteobacteria bacterium]